MSYDNLGAKPHLIGCLCNECMDARNPLPEGPALNVRRPTVSNPTEQFRHALRGVKAHEAVEIPEGLDMTDAARILTEEGGLGAKDEANPKDTLGAAKPQMGLVPLVEAVARVMELGAKKYGPYNWRSKAVKKMVYVHAALRHLMAWVGGQSKDPESGESHLAHVAACMLIVLDAEAHGKAIDDREWVK